MRATTRWIAALCALGLAASCKRAQEPVVEKPPTLNDTLRSMVAQGKALQDIPFATVVKGTTGKELLPVVPAKDPVAQELVDAIGVAVARSIETMNRDESPVRRLRRINEASRFFEDEILAQLNAITGFVCELPPTAAGPAQRSGYPDLKLTHEPSGRVAYLDPKLFEFGAERSTLRTFYYQPKEETNKILEDGHHLLVGIEHDGNDGNWQFVNWYLVDLSKLKIRFKPEFQASNRDIYTTDAIISSSDPN